MWRCLSHNQENGTSITFGKENIGKCDGFQVNVEFALWLLTGEFIFYSYDCVLGKKIKNLCEVIALCIAKQKIANIKNIIALTWEKNNGLESE